MTALALCSTLEELDDSVRRGGLAELDGSPFCTPSAVLAAACAINQDVCADGLARRREPDGVPPLMGAVLAPRVRPARTDHLHSRRTTAGSVRAYPVIKPLADLGAPIELSVPLRLIISAASGTSRPRAAEATRDPDEGTVRRAARTRRVRLAVAGHRFRRSAPAKTFVPISCTACQSAPSASSRCGDGGKV